MPISTPVLSLGKILGAVGFVALAVIFGVAFDEMGVALGFLAFAAVAVLVVVQPWKHDDSASLEQRGREDDHRDGGL